MGVIVEEKALTTSSTGFLFFLACDYRALLILSSLILHLVQVRVLPTEAVPRWLAWAVLWVVTELVVLLWLRKRRRDGQVVDRLQRVSSHATETLLAVAMIAATMLEQVGSVRWIMVNERICLDSRVYGTNSGQPLVALLLDSRQGSMAMKGILPSSSWSKIVALLGTALSMIVLLPDTFSLSMLVSGVAFGICQWWIFFSISFLNNDRVARDERGEASLISRLEIARSIAARGFIAYLLLGLWSGERSTVHLTSLFYASFEALKLGVVYFLVCWQQQDSVLKISSPY